MPDIKSSLVSGLGVAMRLIATILRWARRAIRWVLPWIALVAMRVGTAVMAFWAALLDPDYDRTAGRVSTAHQAPSRSRPAAPPPRPAPQTLAPAATLDNAPPDSALLLLGLFQKEGRLVDFLQEDVSQYGDQDVGAAARIVHTGCRTVLTEYLSVAPVREEPEGSYVTLEPGFDATAIRPTGNVVGEPPFVGNLVHRGWRVTQVRLPQVASGRDLRILAAAEVEL
jgi:hypothetical protein